MSFLNIYLLPATRLTLLLLILFLTDCTKDNKQISIQDNSNNLFAFDALKSSTTGVNFINKVEDQENFNILTYRNYYNGGGVGVGDINNDGLQDLYFTANMGKNKLYLNKGNFTFEDITDKAGVAGQGAWSTGVAMSDVNADGFLDIYVCNSGDVDGKNRQNELFINNGDNTFTEKAAEFGLNDNGYSTHAVFIDLDEDGDLDCYLLNNSYKDPARISFYEKERFKYGAPGGDRIYINESGKFTDKTKESGIYSSDIGFGLGVSFGDLNNDFKPDMFISNDFWERDYLYFNQGKAKFKESLIDQVPYVSVASMGSDIGDLNNDGWLDIFSTDMLPHSNLRLKTSLKFDEYFLGDIKWKTSYYHQYVQNCLHINQQNNTFKEIAYFAGVAATDWSWGALIFDINLDGLKDIYVSNGVYHDITDSDFVDFIGDQNAIRKVVTEKGRYDFRDFKQYLPHNPQKNFAFINQGGLKFKNLADALNIAEEGYSNGAAYGDLDNDGDYDIVINNVNMEASLLKNNAVEKGAKFIKLKLEGPVKNKFGVFTTVKLLQKSGIQIFQSMQSRGFQSSVDPDILFGVENFDTATDSILIVWPDSKYQVLKGDLLNKTTKVSYDDNLGEYNFSPEIRKTLISDITKSILNPEIIHIENPYIDYNSERLMLRLHSTEGPKLVSGDVNNDGLEDVILLGASGQSDQLLIYKNGKYILSRQIAFETDKESESTCGILFDADEDGDLDFLAGNGGNEYQKGFNSFKGRYYQNDGKGNFSKDENKFKEFVGQVSCIESGDFDGDGKQDLFIGGRSVPGNYGLTPRSFIYKNMGGGNYIDVTDAETGPMGMVSAAKWMDIDKDGKDELIVVGEWMPVTVFKYGTTGFQIKYTVPGSNGWWTSLEKADTDSDGDLDLIAGNWGLNSKFKASPDKKITMFTSDFDDNKKVEPIIEWFYMDDPKPYPFASKADLTSQLPILKKKVLKYKDFANSQVKDLISPDKLKKADIKFVETLQSAILLNEKGILTMKALPDEVQLTPIFATLYNDLDGDGCDDIFFGGNFYRLKPEIGRQDGNSGGYLKGDCNGNFNYVLPKLSGLNVQGEVRDAKVINNQLWISRNNESPLVFKYPDFKIKKAN